MQDLQGRLESYIKMQYNQNEILDLYKRQAQVGGKLDLQVIFRWFGGLLSVIFNNESQVLKPQQTSTSFGVLSVLSTINSYLTCFLVLM